MAAAEAAGGLRRSRGRCGRAGARAEASPEVHAPHALPTSSSDAAASSSTLARAEGHDVARSDTPSGYAYRFTDDQLAGGFLDPQGGRIHAIRHADRDVLLRPRMSFVPELLKSVESL